MSQPDNRKGREGREGREGRGERGGPGGPWAPARRFFATTAPGLEAALASELADLGLEGVRAVRSGVSFLGSRLDMVRACVSLRTAHRVLWQLATFEAPSDDALYHSVRRAVRWHGLIPPDKTLAVHATVNDSAIRDNRWAALRVKDAIVDAVRAECGARPSVDAHDPDVRVVLRLHRDHATLSLDAAGESLHARGYRTEARVAPLRETLAAGLILRSGWRGEGPLVDPMCGSGTLLIEAALLARGIAPGLVADRRFGFERWPGHRPQQLEAARAEAAARATPERPLHLFGSDLDQAALGAARANAERAGVADALALTRADAAALVNPAPDAGPGVLVCNPPYGARLSEAEALVPLYRELGEALRGGFPGWDAWMLLAEPMHRDALGLTPAETWPLRNGPLQIRGVRFRIPGARPEPTGGDHDRAAQ